MLMAGAAAGWVGYQFDLPAPIHLTLAILAGMAAGALWGGIVGLLKARTGAHEVIVTIMLNYVAFYLVFYALSEQNLLQAPGSANPKSLPMQDSAILPKLLGRPLQPAPGLPPGAGRRRRRLVDPQPVLPRLPDPRRRREPRRRPLRRHRRGSHLHRRDAHLRWRSSAWPASTRCSARSPAASRVDLDAGIGFDAITVALLGRSRPLGHPVLRACCSAPSRPVASRCRPPRTSPSTSCLVVQSLIVLFIAAPPLIRAIFRLPAREAK